MKIIQREIFKEHLILFLLIGSCLLGLILVGRLLQLREMLLAQNLNAFDILKLFVYLSPFFMLMLTPIACMLSVFLTYLRMSNDRELTALRASGVSLYQLLPATLAFSLLCTAFSFYISLFGLSWGMERFKVSLMEFARTKTQLSLQSGVFNQEFPGLTIYAQQVDLATGDIRFIFVQDRSNKGFTNTVVAPEATVVTDADKEQIRIQFRNGRIYRRQDEQLDVLNFGTYAVRLPLGRMLRNMGFERISPKELSYAKLLQYDNDPEMAKELDSDRQMKVKVELQKRLALPLGCLVLGLFSVPVACVFRALKQQHGLLLSLAVFLVYYGLMSVFESLGEGKVIPPAVGMWLPNALFAGTGFMFLRQAVAERVPGFVLAAIQRLQRRAA